MAELSERSGVAVATIKYYRREGLLPAGEHTAPNQADYTDAHLGRLRLIRTLREVADLPVASLRDVVAAIEDPGRSLHEVVGAAHAALDGGAGDQAPDVARSRADEVIARAGWDVAATAPARTSLAGALAALDDLGLPTTPDVLDRYVRAADAVAREEVAATMGPGAAPSRDAVVARVVAGTVLFEHVLTALRRLAQEHHSSRRGSDVEPPHERP
jgi:DNA-binding transcriptional MerR regulator